MAKFIKSLFTPERSKAMRLEDEIEGEMETPPLHERRKLSMSRSGRLKQSVKKRQQLCVDVYGGEDIQSTEKPKSMEYHVHTPVTTKAQEPQFDSGKTTDNVESTTDVESRPDNTGSKTPEEEIDRAFEIIDKS